MSDKGTKKKVERVETPVDQEQTNQPIPRFRASEEAKGRAKSLRLFAILAFLIAFAAEGYAIYLLRKPPINMTWLLVMMAISLVGALVGSTLWKKSNRLDPASEKDKTRFFLQNQLGAILSVLAFLPLVILVITDKNLTSKQKGILGSVGVAALLIASIYGTDFSPPSQEQYAQQIQEVEQLTGQDFVYWTKSGTVYHVYQDCQHINTNKTDKIFEGSVAQARELKNITDLCKTCKNRALKDPTFTKATTTAN